MMRSVSLWATLVVAVLITPWSSADPVTATFNSHPAGVSPGRFINVTFFGTTYNNVGTGIYNWTGSASNAAPFNGAFSSVCIDFTGPISFGETYTFESTTNVASAPTPYTWPNQSGGMGTEKANALRALFDAQWANAHTSQDQAAAFQLATWELIYDAPSSGGMFSLGSGNVKISSTYSTLRAMAKSFAETAWAARASATGVNLIALTHPTKQDHLTMGPGVVVPLPPAALAGGVLLAALAIVRRFGRVE